MYELIDKTVESLNQTCFDKCEKPLNVTSDCYLTCFEATTLEASVEQLVKPWFDAFDGACPPLPESAITMINDEIRGSE